MRAADLLTAWEQGQARSPAVRAQALLAAVGIPPRDGLALTVGQRDSLLLDLRGELFGLRVTAIAPCPACAELLELDFDLDDVRARPPGDPAAIVEFAVDGYVVRARPPTGADLAALEQARPGPNTWRQLLARCVVDARLGAEEVGVDNLPASLTARLGECFATADPQADVQLNLCCPDCATSWTTTFDIVSFLWQELDAWARRLVREVHTLATAYGWSETDIVAMGSWRRAVYLDLARP
jgi:hypothetical protein